METHQVALGLIGGMAIIIGFYYLLKTSIRYVLCLLLVGVSLFVFVGNTYGNNAQATVSSKSKLNIRSGPGKDFNIVDQLMPGEIVDVINIDNTANGWTKISKSNGVKGYVSDTYLSGDYLSTFENRFGKDDYDDITDYLLYPSLYSSLYANLLKLDHELVLVLFIFIFIVEACIIIWLKFKYASCKNTSPLIAYIVLVISMILTFPTFPLYIYALKHDTWAIVIYVLMLLSTSCLMLHAAWRIKLCGMYLGKNRDYDSYSYQVGRWIGNILWLILLIPFAKIWWDICDVSRSNVYHMENGFGNMLLTLLCMLVINWVVTKFLWAQFIVKYLFQTANQGIVHIMSIILCWGIISYEYCVIDYNFNGIIFFFALLAFFPVLTVAFCYALSTITEHRCANCHSYCTRQTGFTDLGNTYRTSRTWKDMDESAVNRRIDRSIVTDSQKLVRTTETVSRWRTRHSCFNCMNAWDIDHEATIDKSSQTLKKEWTEHY